MPNLVDLLYERHLHLLLFLYCLSYCMPRAPNSYFRTFSLKTELIFDKLIQLELDSVEGQTVLTERGLGSCYWC